MANAVVKNKMDHWPPHTVLVHLDEPIHYFDRETGKKLAAKYVAVNSRHPDIHSADYARIDVFPCDAEGGFVEDTLVPIRKVEFQRITTALEGLGFDVVDENNTLMLMPGG
jgi:hypothetical protein